MAFVPTVSVIVPVYNGAATIASCVECLMALEYPEDRLEIIVVDNASTDDTPSILSRFSGRIAVLHEERPGPSAARNHGIREAKGDLLAFTDADCEVTPDWLTQLVRPLSDENTGIAAGSILAKRPCTEIERFSEILDDHRVSTSRRVPSAITMNWASPAALIRELGGFDEALRRGEDDDLSYRVFLSGRRIVYAENAVVYHSNERTLLGLMREGYRHGFASVRLSKKHVATRRSLGVRRLYVSTYRRLVQDLVHVLLDRERTRASCSFVFNSGKKAGRIVGSVRFAHLAL